MAQAAQQRQPFASSVRGLRVESANLQRPSVRAVGDDSLRFRPILRFASAVLRSARLTLRPTSVLISNASPRSRCCHKTMVSEAVSVHFSHVELVGNGWGSPVPGQEVVEAAGWMPIGRALEHVLEISKRLDIVELGRGDEGADGCPAVGAGVGSGEQVVFAAKRDRPDRALDGVGVKFEASIIEEAAESVPAGQR